MSDLAKILTGDDRTWLAALPKHAAKTIADLRTGGVSDEDIARTWLTSMGPEGVSPLGSRDKAAFFDAFKKEFHGFVCGDRKYEKDRTRLIKEFSGSQVMAVAAISSAIAPAIGAAAPLLVPPTAMMIIVVAKLGLNAWCATLTKQPDANPEDTA